MRKVIFFILLGALLPSLAIAQEDWFKSCLSTPVAFAQNRNLPASITRDLAHTQGEIEFYDIEFQQANKAGLGDQAMAAWTKLHQSRLELQRICVQASQ